MKEEEELGADNVDQERGQKEENPQHVSKTKMSMFAVGAAAKAHGKQKVNERSQQKKEEEEQKKN